MPLRTTLYCAALLHALAPDRLLYVADGALAVLDGRIVFAGERREATARHPHAPQVNYPNGLLLPGLVDTHVHLPQWPIAGTGRGELLHWLHTYVFPVEAECADIAVARSRAVRFFRDALACGTTTMAVYSSPFLAATDEAFRAAAASGIRALMGRTLMDRGAPDVLLADAERNIADSLHLARDWHMHDGGRLRYALTPRFALSCTPALLQRCGEVARVDGLPVQTHLAENPAELRAVAEAFPDCSSYTDVYDRFGLLTDRSILAHCIYLTPHERQRLLECGCAVAHCPSSNRFLQSGVMPVRRYLREGLRTALGTDVGAGYSLSMLNEAKEAVESSKTWNLLHRGQEEEPLAPEEALWLATLGGARALGLDDVTGNFLPGKDADFLVVDAPQPRNGARLSVADIVARLLYGEHSVQATYVRGRLCYGATVS